MATPCVWCVLTDGVDVFHASTCTNYNCRNCSVVFATGAEAEAAGFKPAGDCLR